MAHAFLQYLPQDNSLATNPDAEQVVATIGNQLGALLHKDDDAFWEAVEASASALATCLDSYLCHMQYVLLGQGIWWDKGISTHTHASPFTDVHLMWSPPRP